MLVDKDVKVIFVMGGPGSGKAAQSKRMAERYGLTLLSTGHLLRTDIARGSEGGKRLQRIMTQGEFVSLTDIMNLLKEAIRANASGSPGFIIEGFPRDAEQAAMFAAEVAPCHVVIFLEIPEELMRHRLLKRNQYVDIESTISTKLRLYNGRTKPVIEKFAKRGLVIKINALGTEEDVFQRLIRGLTNFTVSKAKRSQSASAAFSKSGKQPGKLASQSSGVQKMRNSLLPIHNLSQPKHQPDVWKRTDWTYRNGSRLTSKGQNMSVMNSYPQKVTVSRADPFYRYEQYPQAANRAGPPVQSEKYEQASSRAESSHRHEKRQRTASWVELLHTRESHPYADTMVEPSNRHKSHMQTRHRAVLTSIQPTRSPIEEKR